MSNIIFLIIKTFHFVKHVTLIDHIISIANCFLYTYRKQDTILLYTLDFKECRYLLTFNYFAHNINNFTCTYNFGTETGLTADVIETQCTNFKLTVMPQPFAYIYLLCHWKIKSHAVHNTIITIIMCLYFYICYFWWHLQIHLNLEPLY